MEHFRNSRNPVHQFYLLICVNPAKLRTCGTLDCTGGTVGLRATPVVIHCSIQSAVYALLTTFAKVTLHIYVIM